MNINLPFTFFLNFNLILNFRNIFNNLYNKFNSILHFIVFNIENSLSSEPDYD